MVVLMVLAAALSLIATIFVAGAAGYVSVASHLRHADTYWFPFAIAGAVAAQIGYTFAYREVAHVGRGVKLSALRASAIVSAGFGMFIPRGGFAVDIEALEDLGVPRDEARVRVLGLGSLEYAVLATGALICAIFLLVEPLGRAARGHALVDDRRPGRDSARAGRRPLPQVDLPRLAEADPRAAARGDRRRRADRRLAAPARGRGLLRDGSLLGGRGVRPLGLPRRLHGRYAVGGSGRRRLRDRLRAHPADAPARRRRRRRGAAAVRARLGRLQPRPPRSSRSSPTASSTSGYRSAPRPWGSTTCSGERRRAQGR